MSNDEQKNDSAAAPDPGTPDAQDPSVPIDFNTFILSLSSSAAFHLGLAPHPEKECACKNLPMAQQTIDILDILQDKTKGNLTGEEERLLGDVLYNLRIAFVRESSRCSQ